VNNPLVIFVFVWCFIIAFFNYWLGYRRGKIDQIDIDYENCTVGGHEPPCIKCPHCGKWVGRC
jgi:hypothetical protein